MIVNITVITAELQFMKKRCSLYAILFVKQYDLIKGTSFNRVGKKCISNGKKIEAIKSFIIKSETDFHDSYSYSSKYVK